MIQSVTNKIYFKRGLWLAALIVLCDQISKWWILDVFHLPAKGMVEIMPFVNFVMVWNRGVSFGMLEADGLGRWLLVGMTVVIAIVVLIWLRKADRGFIAIALAFILGGAIGNIIDRIRFGAVADFIQLYAGEYSFYVFNIADAGISIGVALLLMDAILSGRQDDTAER